MVGIDLEDPKLGGRVGHPAAAEPRSSQAMPVERLAFADGEFDLVAATEVLEHVPDPAAALAEMARVAGAFLLVSVPHEPLWRALNLARGAYLRELGNTPGHLNHWTRRAFVALLGTLRRGGADPLAVPVDHAAGAGPVTSVRAAPRRRPRGSRASSSDDVPRDPPAATAAGARAGPDKPSFASGARILSIGIASTGIFTFAYLATASHVLEPDRLRLRVAVLGDHVRDPVGDLPADRAAALAHDRRPAGPRDARPHRSAAPALIQVSASRSLFLIVALALRERDRSNGMFGGSARSTGSWSSASLAYAASYFARGWLAGNKRFALYGGLVFLESTSRFLFALAVAVGIGSGQDAGRRSAWPSRRSCRCRSSRSRSRAHPRLRAPAGAPIRRRRRPRGPRPRPARGGHRRPVALRTAAGFAVAVVGIMLSEQTLMNAGVLIVAATRGGGRPDHGPGRLRVQRDADRPRPAAALPGDPDLDPPPPGRARGPRERDEFHRAIRITILVIAAFGLAVALGLLLIGPAVMTLVLGDRAASATAVSACRSSASGWGCTSPRGRSTRPRWPGAGPLGGGLLADGGGAVRGLRRHRAEPATPRSPGRGRLLRRHRVLARAALACTAGAGLRERRRPPRSGRRRRRIAGAEHRRSGDEEVGAGLHARGRGRVVDAAVDLERDARRAARAHPLELARASAGSAAGRPSRG